MDIYDKLEVELNNTLSNVKLVGSVNIMMDERLLVVRVNNSGKSESYTEDYVTTAKIVKSVVTSNLNYKPWLEFDHGLPKEFIVFIFVKGE